MPKGTAVVTQVRLLLHAECACGFALLAALGQVHMPKGTAVVMQVRLWCLCRIVAATVVGDGQVAAQMRLLCWCRLAEGLCCCCNQRCVREIADFTAEFEHKCMKGCCAGCRV
jgi:hypothetical protein